jgi:hypothetical protein
MCPSCGYDDWGSWKNDDEPCPVCGAGTGGMSRIVSLPARPSTWDESRWLTPATPVEHAFW